MKQENNENRPSFGLMKLNNIISYYHMQMPRWLFSDSGYSDMMIESKVAYTFLLNRFQLSRRNGWVNRYGEVYVIYTREDLAQEMQVSYKKAIACIKELTEKKSHLGATSGTRPTESHLPRRSAIQRKSGIFV